MFIFEEIQNIEKCNIQEKWKYLKRTFDVSQNMKEPKTSKDFIEILSEDSSGHKVIFTDSEKKRAEVFFSYTSYYRFSIFPRLIKEDSMRTFSNVLEIYRIDLYLNREIHKFSQIIEIWLKTSLTQALLDEYESTHFSKGELYLDFNIYRDVKYAKEVLNSFADTINKSKAEYMVHHKRCKEGCVPIWVLMEELTFGQVETFYSHLKNTHKTAWIEQSFGLKLKKFIGSWLNTARYLRNITSHNGRLYGSRFTILPKLTNEDKKAFNIKENRKANLFIMLLTEKNLLSYHPLQKDVFKEWNTFVDELSEIIDGDLFDLELNDFPTNWYNALHIAVDDK